MRCEECNAPLESDDLSERLCRECREAENEPDPERPLDFRRDSGSGPKKSGSSG